MVIDPVCLSQLDEREAEQKAEHRGEVYYFNTERCRQVFERDPEEYAGQVVEAVYGDHGSRFPGHRESAGAKHLHAGVAHERKSYQASASPLHGRS